MLSCVEKMAKIGIRAVFHVKRHTATAPVRHRLSVKLIAPVRHRLSVNLIAQLYREKILRFVFRYLGVYLAPFLLLFYYLRKSNIDCRISRGQVTRLLQVAFLRGPSERRSIQLMGAIL